MNCRVYGIIGIKSVMANWNADFTGYPKTTSNDDVFGSDKALKYPKKVMWNRDGEKVLYIKSMKLDEKKNAVAPRTLKERYEFLFDVADLKKEKKQCEVVRNLFTAIDVKQFGATFAEADNNIGITGAVQIGQGFNKYEDSYAEEQQILSPFVDAKAQEKKKAKEKSKGGEGSGSTGEGAEDEGAKATTLGTKVVSDEAHYVYPFAITPSVYDEYVKLGLTDGYTEQDYHDFKESALVSATAFNTNSKMGCENEISVFVEVDKECYLPDLAQFVTFKKGAVGEKNVILLGFDELIGSMKDRVKKIEIYYNPYTTVVEHSMENAQSYNIFTKEEIV